MMSLGLFLFELETAPYQSFQQQLAWRHPANARVGLRPARQFLGNDDESIHLSGVLYHEITGGQVSLEVLRRMAETGNAWVLIGGDGVIHGCFVIESLEMTYTVFNLDGSPKKIEFSLKLARTDDDDIGNLDPLTASEEQMGC
jgi:phage protein U